jgi:hypothetical protein
MLFTGTAEYPNLGSEPGQKQQLLLEFEWVSLPNRVALNAPG